MNWLADEQRRRNRLSQQAWQRFAPHRQRVTDLLLQAQRGPHERLGVLGAGNCNDLDLSRLLLSYGEIHLLDGDQEAVLFGVRQQRVADSSQIHVHPPQDLTGVLDSLAEPGADQEGEIAPLLGRKLRQTTVQPPVADLDVVASACMVTQLIESLTRAMGGAATALADLAVDMRHQHLRLMLCMLRPGGRAVLITDFVSSDSCPELPGVSEAQLSQAARQWINRQNFFTGANPFAVQRHLLEHGELPVLRESVEIIRPWKWDFGCRIYAVSAIRFQKAVDRPPTVGLDAATK